MDEKEDLTTDLYPEAERINSDLHKGAESLGRKEEDDDDLLRK